jgi:hypothetical protein
MIIEQILFENSDKKKVYDAKLEKYNEQKVENPLTPKPEKDYIIYYMHVILQTTPMNSRGQISANFDGVPKYIRDNILEDISSKFPIISDSF